MIHAPHLLAQEPAAAALPKGSPRPWWEGRPFVAAMILLAFVPLLYPQIPPLVDVGGHMGRYSDPIREDTRFKDMLAAAKNRLRMEPASN